MTGHRLTGRAAAFAAAAALIVLLAGCSKEVVPETYQPTPDHESYVRSLERAALDETALGRDWLEAAESALDSPISVEPPYQEQVYFDPSEASGVGYRFSARRGQNVVVEVEPDGELRLYLDLYREETRSETYVHVASAPEDENRLELHVQSDSTYVLRLQPELLRGGTFNVSIRVGPSLAFPIQGLDTKSIFSWFGAPRDGGTRRHEGVDILAPRGTEVVAPIRAYVRWVGINRRGGNVVGLTDEKYGLYLYFAHLEEQIAKSGTYVEPGDVLGTVGNTGNAVTTVPHLHFGVYMRTSGRRSAVDPFYYLYDPKKQMAEITADTSLLGEWARSSAAAALREPAEPDSGSAETPLAVHTLFRILAAAAGGYRVRLPDGRRGYLDAGAVEALTEPLEVERIETETALLANPDSLASVITRTRAGQRLEILAGFEEFLYVRVENGSPGWIPADQRSLL